MISVGNFLSQVKFSIAESKILCYDERKILVSTRIHHFMKRFFQLIFVYEFTDLANFCSTFFQVSCLYLINIRTEKEVNKLEKSFTTAQCSG